MSSDKPSSPPASGGGASPAAGATGNCPCPADFVLATPCRIVKAGGGQITFTASELPDCSSSGNYVWTTPSTKVRLTGDHSSSCTVEGLANAGSGRDSEIITVTRSGPGCTPIVKTIAVTVAKVVFSASPNQTYGFDNFDTAADFTDDHVNVKQLDHTFVQVDITGGATAADFDFACAPGGICTPVAPAGGTSFDLRLNGEDQPKAETTLQAKVKCPGNAVFAHIQVHVYKEMAVNVVVAKFFDSTQAGTTLRFPNANYAAETPTYNAKIKEGVAKYTVTNFNAGNAATDVAFDLDGNGALSFDINAGGGPEYNTLVAAFTGTGTKRRVMIVRAMKSYYYLSAAAAIGDPTITVTSASVFTYPGGSYPLGLGAAQENVAVATSSGSVITLGAPLTKAHAIGEGLEFPAVGWSTDPIIVVESTDAFDVLKWTVCHEVGHRDLLLADIDVDTTTIMYYNRGRTDYRLRYCPRTKRYNGGGTENQWETIPRT